MTVGSLGLLLPGLASPPPATTARVVKLGGALAATFTVSVIGGARAPAASTSERVQVSVASVHDQPVPARPLAFKPFGSVSVTFTAPLVGPAPPLLTVSV